MLVALTLLAVFVAVGGATGEARAAGQAGGSRIVAGSPAPVPGAPYLNGVSCLSPSHCMAVGGMEQPTGRAPFAELWTGSAWREIATPAPLGETDLSAVSCTRASFCMAAGTAGTERWNGSAWRLESTPAGARTASLHGISCSTASRCEAVGGKGPGPATLAEGWNGTTWRVQATPMPAGATSATLDSVACVSVRHCIAVGGYSGPGLISGTLAESWNGHAWTILGPATLTSTNASLSGISCTSATRCVAVGYAYPDTLAEAWDGSSWQVLPAPAAQATAISCTGTSGCLAVGGAISPVAESWNGTAWTALTPPGSGGLSGVSCTRTSACMAVGGRGSLAMSWSGTTWRIYRVVKSDGVSAVWCALATKCMAVGGFTDGSERPAALGESWDGRRFRVTPGLAGVIGSLFGVSCVSARDCVAVGGAGTEEGLTLAAAWNGRSWRVMSTPSLGTGSQEYAVSCKGNRCLAVGRRMLAELWDGTSWRVLPVPRPHPFYSGELNDVSCASATDCVVAGFYFGSAQGNSLSLAEQWNGSKWRRLSPPGGGLSGISCPATDFCVGVRGSQAMTWNGRAWHLSRLPGPFGYGPGIVSVSCSGRSSCMAAGNYVTNGGALGHDVAEIWNGKTWRRLATGGPGGGLSDVSCTRPTRCVAVGQAPSGPVSTMTLAERWTGKIWLLFRTPNP